MLTPDPTFPPLLTGHAVPASADVFEDACRGAQDGRFGAGDFVWSRRTDTVSLALVLEPEVPASRSFEMLFLTMVAANDALGAITPPETALTFLWPDVFKVNGAKVGRARLATSDELDDDGAPLWLTVALEFRLAPLDGPLEPGETPDRTSLIDEGAVDLDRTQVIESLSRHLLTWIHSWDVDGFAPVLDNWLFRAEGYRGAHAVESVGGVVEGTFLGLDEEGNLLIKRDAASGGDTLSLRLREHLSSHSLEASEA
ncbi:biotin/lipoate--protein ligase family protein [Stappia sp. ES.058]|uniref:biotin/lipoate--protein ligase family protein n=1 Tax=Stappia sp. ES.058 TaxID=1881061 RepID=UPI0008793F06|nr:biotin/lipoate--protein ligase family protein [Stappia sp. ES.058]SDU05190.1 Biotin-(acetyl-CoA carboxylase) ligase [Stappia sp. ES.058]